MSSVTNPSSMRMLPGRSWPLGSSQFAKGVNFAVFSAHASAVELCIFDSQGRTELARLPLPAHTDDVWHGFLPDAGEGLIYGYRVYGPYEPTAGHRFNPNKLLLDPYARRWHGDFVWHDANFGYIRGHADKDLSFDTRDSSPYVLKSVVVRQPRPSARLQKRRLGHTSDIPTRRKRLSDELIYEGHVKGLTALLPGVAAKRRGTYRALGSKPFVTHLKTLGVTVLELLPVHGFIDDEFLVERDLVNYWGYQSLGFFLAEQRYASSSDATAELRDTVGKLHKAGIQVILDVVYNHTGEGNELGPTLCYRGLDNLSYYRLERNPRYYINDSGTGNTLAVGNSRVLQMITDSLRQWVNEVDIDGFRFDLASILGREIHGFDRGCGFFDAIAQDPDLADVHLIAEPWDIGPGGYQLGQYPRRWSEWNDQFRDTVRRFWNSDADLLHEFADRLLGSSSVFEWQERDPAASVNFITAHDGFTLRDTVSYAYKHNEANGELNRDGHGTNHSNNHGVEGETDDAQILALRLQQQRNLLCSLFFSQGTPMLLAGDERNRTQRGNNNAYCQDNSLTWLSWQSTSEADSLQHFTQRLIRFRERHPVLRRSWYLHGKHLSASTDLPDVSWLNANAQLMEEADWHRPGGGFVALQLMGDALPEECTLQPSTTLLLLFNAGHNDIVFPLSSPHLAGLQWTLELDSCNPDLTTQSVSVSYVIEGLSVAALSLTLDTAESG
ncbi:MAG: glycogen debranching protein GlgX [Granulosicoccus sp.]